MEHLAKRRRLEHRLDRQLSPLHARFHSKHHPRQSSLDGEQPFGSVAAKAQQDLSIAKIYPIEITPHDRFAQPVGLDPDSGSIPTVIELRRDVAESEDGDGQPLAGSIAKRAQNIADNLIQPIDQPVKSAAGNAVNLVQSGANAVVQPVQSNVVNPVVSQVADNPITNDKSQISPDTPASPVEGPGLVSPLPAVAAAAARESALQTQEEAAAQLNPSLPAAEGPAPPPPVVGAINAMMAGQNVPSGQPSKAGPVAQTMSSPSSVSSKSIQPAAPTSTQMPPAGSLATPSPQNSTSAISSLSASDSAASASSASQASISSMSAHRTSSIPSSLSTSSFLSSDTSLNSSPSTLMTITSSPSASSFQSASTVSSGAAVGPGALGGSPTTGSSTGPTGNSTTSDQGGSNPPPTKVLVGGIVGGVAGAVLILLALLFLLRWKKSRMGTTRNISPPVPQTANAGSAALGGAMTQRSSTRSNVPIAAAALFNRLRPPSSQTATTSSTGPSERGFQKLSGRKLPSVLHSGGDGYGDAPALPLAAAGAKTGETEAPAAKSIMPGQGPFAGLAPGLRPSSPNRQLSGSSFYRDSNGFYGGVVRDSSTSDQTEPSSSPTASSPSFPVPPSSAGPLTGGASSGSTSMGLPNIRPGPARQPVIQQGGIVPMRTPPRGHQAPGNRSAPSPISEHPRDPVGRSHPSQDNSRQSRFRESSTP